ncbi:MAG: HTH domain-containing protein, partial [Bacteroidota bacterium]
MNHLSRLLSILTMLKSKRIVTGSELAQKFDVSVRTIYRDIKKLEESGVPIMTIEGRGYAIMDGYTVAPIMFDEMEVNALVTAEQLIAQTNDDSLIQHFQQTLQKIKSVFRSSLQEQAEVLDRSMIVLKKQEVGDRTASLAFIQMALINRRVTELVYKAKDKEPTYRKI